MTALGWVLSGVGIYVAGFLFTAWLNLGIGPVTPGLALLRGAVWPLWWATGRPEGQRLPMD